MGSMAHHIYQHHGSYGFCGVKSGALSKIQQFSFDDIPNQNFPGFPIAMFDYWRVTKATVHIIISYLPNPVLIRCKLPWDKNEQKDVENSPMGRAYEHHQLSTAIARNTTYKSASHPICGITTSYINYRKKPVITSYNQLWLLFRAATCTSRVCFSISKWGRPGAGAPMLGAEILTLWIQSHCRADMVKPMMFHGKTIGKP